jgi:hypothetical protein
MSVLDRQVFKSFSDTVLSRAQKEEEDTRKDPSIESLPESVRTPRMPINTGVSTK